MLLLRVVIFLMFFSLLKAKSCLFILFFCNCCFSAIFSAIVLGAFWGRMASRERSPEESSLEESSLETGSLEESSLENSSLEESSLIRKLYFWYDNFIFSTRILFLIRESYFWYENYIFSTRMTFSIRESYV